MDRDLVMDHGSGHAVGGGMDIIIITPDEYAMLSIGKYDAVICIGSAKLGRLCKSHAKNAVWCHMVMTPRGMLLADETTKLFDFFVKHVIETRTLIQATSLKRCFILQENIQRKAAGVGFAMSCILGVDPSPAGWLTEFPKLSLQTAMVIIARWQSLAHGQVVIDEKGGT